MPSQANRHQIMIVVFTEAMVDMLSKQLSLDGFDKLRADLVAACDAAYPVLKADPNGGLTDTKKPLVMIERFRARFPEFECEDAIAFCIAKLSDQLVYTQKHGRKQGVFQKLLETVENIYWFFDPAGEYQGRAGYEAAEVFDGLEF